MAALEGESCDYVIVGAGAAGCVLAERLTASGARKVVLLEAGGADRGVWIKVPAGFTRTMYDRRVNWAYETAPGPGIDGRRIYFPRGKVLGGSSAINGHLYVRGQAADYDGWAQAGCRGWAWEDVLPYFRKAERRLGGDPATRGAEGPLHVQDQRSPHALSRAFVDAAVATGLPRNPDYNSGDQEGAALYQQLMRAGVRWSAADAYLRPALKRPNLRVIAEALATRVLFEGRRAVGIAYEQGGESRTIRAREVLLCGGSINSPQLLQLSGVGDGERLQALGLEVTHHLPRVGENLRDHYAARVAVRVKGARTLNELTRGLPLVAEVCRYALTRRGLLAASPAHGGAFARTRPELATPDVQFFFAPASYAAGAFGRADLEREPGMTCGAIQARPESRGWVRALSPDPREAPEIQPNYLTDPLDRATIVAGLKLARRFFATEPLSGYVAGEIFPGPACADDEALLAHARATGATTYHPVGTCRMGADPDAVTDPATLRVRGLDGLRVIDASVMPHMVSANTYAATNMIAEKGADLVLAD
jgi:choline dehydrogenase